ncbi:MAG: PorV/PorQ family protein, partial [Candidatus Desantisbacteria bacterium]
RVAAIGGAFVGLADDASCHHYNPAGLSNIKQRELLVMESEAIMECGYEYLGFAQPLKKGQGIGGAILYFHAPEMIRTIENKNKPEGYEVVGTIEYYDLSASFSYGRRIKKDLSLGGTIKLIRRMISPNKGITGAIDLGLLYQANKDLRLGASLQHFGPKVWGDTLPQLIQAGASYKIQNLILTGAVSHHLIASSDPEFRVGAEYWYWKDLALRAGYYWLEGSLEGATMGAGVRVKDYLQIDFSQVPGGLDRPLQGSILIKF